VTTLREALIVDRTASSRRCYPCQSMRTPRPVPCTERFYAAALDTQLHFMQQGTSWGAGPVAVAGDCGGIAACGVGGAAAVCQPAAPVLAEARAAAGLHRGPHAELGPGAVRGWEPPAGAYSAGQNHARPAKPVSCRPGSATLLLEAQVLLSVLEPLQISGCSACAG